ncbi:MAG: hypothetical protein IJI41_10150 [Anaerolineaceae bacterium]|nr:hypothetical protein [Anaerolineaceae bacterium]
MDELNKKRKKTVVMALVFLVIFTGILLVAEWYLFRIDIQKDGQFKAESIRKTIVSYMSDSEEMTEWFYEKLKENVRLTAFILKNQIQDGTYRGRYVFDDGVVIQMKNGQAVLPPEGEALFPNLQPEDIVTEYTPKRVMTADGREFLITSGMIQDDLYFLTGQILKNFTNFLNPR